MNLNKTKIVATIGPASSSRSMLSKLISSGVDVFRINFSHASHKEVKRIVSDIKALRLEPVSYTHLTLPTILLV